MADRINLILLPYAGGSAGIFREWKARLPAWIDPVPLTLPGRGIRHGEPLLYEWAPLMDILVREVAPYIDRPFALFGHSLGALTALELARALCRMDKHAVWLGVSGCIAPSQRQPESKWLHCPEEEFLAKIRSLNGTPVELLENRELLDLVLPILRADFHLAGTHEYCPQRRLRLPIPMLILGGCQDEGVMRAPENLSAWRDETLSVSRVEMIDAGHFFIDTHRNEVIRSIITDLENLRAGVEWAHA